MWPQFRAHALESDKDCTLLHKRFNLNTCYPTSESNFTLLSTRESIHLVEALCTKIEPYSNDSNSTMSFAAIVCVQPAHFDIGTHTWAGDVAGSGMRPRREEEETVQIGTADAGARTYTIRVAPSDIDSCVEFSLVRCMFTVLGLILVLTDIPRTCLGLSTMEDYFDVIGLDTVMYFGPYAYQVAHISQENSSWQGTCAGAAINTVDVWAYKFDSLSIPTRALAEQLNVSAYPRCVLYLERCADTALSLPTAFRMLDDLVSALTARHFPERTSTKERGTPSPFKFATTSRWIDRLHHFVVKFFSKHTELRTHVVHHFDPSSEQLHDTHICDPRLYTSAHSTRPLVCDLLNVWICEHPELGPTYQVPIWEHLTLRVATLRAKYPELELDLTMVTSRVVLWSRQWVIFPAVRYATDTLEVSTIIRGRNCSQRGDGSANTHAATAAASSCTTVFVDDYRYERALVVNDANQWYMVTSVLRGTGQIFMWIRFLSLWIGCYAARTAEKKFHAAKWYTKLYYTLFTLVKIPSHAIIYGNWWPILCYALAHCIDGALVQLINNTIWSTVNGTVHFEPIKYFTIASIQMRNIWFVALFVKLAMVGYQRFFHARARRWTIRHGIIGVRGMLFGTLSGLTVFSCLRVRTFRDTSIVAFEVLPEISPLGSALAFGFANTAEFGIHFDAKILCIAAAVLLVAVLCTQVLAHCLSLTTPKCYNVALYCHSYYVPHSAGPLWSTGSFLVYWRMRLSPATPTAAHEGSQCDPPPKSLFSMLASCLRSKVSPMPQMEELPAWDASEAVTSRPSAASTAWCRFCDFPRQGKHMPRFRWHVVQGCPLHDNFIDIDSRSKAHWSVVRLQNIAMMTDPMVLLRLCVIGQPVFIYRVKSRQLVSSASAVQLDAIETRTPVLATTLPLEANPPNEALGRENQATSMLSPGRVYVLPCQLSDVLKSFASMDGCEDKSQCLARYELVGTTNSCFLPWTLLVNCG